MFATNSTGRANHSLLMSSASRNAVAFDVPPTASHQNNSAKLVRANAAAYCRRTVTGVAQRPIGQTAEMAKNKRRRTPKTVLKLPDLEQSKSAVLNSLTCLSGLRGK